MITNEQRKFRKSGIFSSDTPRIMAGQGLRVALEKLEVLGNDEDEDPFADDIEMALGTKAEAAVLDSYESLEKVQLVRNPPTVMSEKYPWLGCHQDAEEKNVVNVEAKTVGWYRRKFWGEGGDEVPSDVIWQTQQQMLVRGLTITRVPVMFVDAESLKRYILRMYGMDVTIPIKVYTIPADKELQEIIIEKTKYVWDCVQRQELPEPENFDDFMVVYRQDAGTSIEADEEILEAYTLLMDTRERLKPLEKAKERLESLIKLFMKENSRLTSDVHTLITWKADADSEYFDLKEFSADNPEIYKKYLKPKKGSRRFLPKTIKLAAGA